MTWRKQVIVTGGSSGLGRAICSELDNHHGFNVHNWDVDRVDVTDYKSVAHAVDNLDTRHIDILVNCAGINHPEYITKLNSERFDLTMAVNAKAIFLTTQALLKHFTYDGTICNIISNASHMPMTASLAYNASKAAAHMMTLQMARELWQTHHLTVFGISPNRLQGTSMSNHVDECVGIQRNWTSSEVKKQQLSKLAIGEETDPATLAEFIGFLLSSKQRHKYLHGTVIPYGA